MYMGLFYTVLLYQAHHLTSLTCTGVENSHFSEMSGKMLEFLFGFFLPDA